MCLKSLLDANKGQLLSSSLMEQRGLLASILLACYASSKHNTLNVRSETMLLYNSCTLKGFTCWCFLPRLCWSNTTTDSSSELAANATDRQTIANNRQTAANNRQLSASCSSLTEQPPGVALVELLLLISHYLNYIALQDILHITGLIHISIKKQ